MVNTARYLPGLKCNGFFCATDVTDLQYQLLYNDSVILLKALVKQTSVLPLIKYGECNRQRVVDDTAGTIHLANSDCICHDPSRSRWQQIAISGLHQASQLVHGVRCKDTQNSKKKGYHSQYFIRVYLLLWFIFFSLDLLHGRELPLDVHHREDGAILLPNRLAGGVAVLGQRLDRVNGVDYV